jgi:hypothetical protein
MIARGIKHTAEHKVSTALILLLVIALVIVSTARISIPSGASASQPEVQPIVNAAPNSTEDYFRGQSTFDSALIWDSLSPELISRAEMSGASRDDLQMQLDQARELGRSVETISYIGAYNMDDGTSMQFYVATVRSSDVMPPDHIFYVFTLDPDGKIESIE